MEGLELVTTPSCTNYRQDGAQSLKSHTYRFQSCFLLMCVLGLARTGLIFTGLQEGAQPGGWGLTPPGQTEPGIPYHVS